VSSKQDRSKTELCPCGSTDHVVRRGLCRKCRREGAQPHASRQGAGGGREGQAKLPVAEQIALDREKAKTGGELATLKLKYKGALNRIEQLEREAEAMVELRGGVERVKITPSTGSGTSEATVVAALSDWHGEELVTLGETSGLNESNPEIITERALRAFRGILRLTQLLQQDVKIDNLVLALLGDFITNDIHGAENAEKNALQPTHALVFVQNLLINGLQFLLDNSKLTITLPCHTGNHGRTTQTTRFGAENGHSLEYLMYLHLASWFRHDPRVRFLIAEGMHSYLEVYDQTIRFHHGHAVKYGGGVGGIYIPVNKAIAQWNIARRADVDVFGHFHQYISAPNFQCNGSLIGYNSYALSIKATYEPPRQALFLMDKKRGRTCSWPILVERK
jgi:hypothetical protein